jgi:hypothetical protein
LLAVGILLGGCASVDVIDPKSSPAPLIQENPALADLYEAVFRHQFQKHALHDHGYEMEYFLSISGEDPPSYFIERFEGNNRLVRCGSLFRKGEGLLFTIDGLEWKNRDLVRIYSDYYEDDMAREGMLFVVKRDSDGKWRIIKDQVLWIA